MSPPLPRIPRPGLVALSAVWALMLASSAFAGGFEVVSTSPSAHAVGAPTAGTIEVSFDQPLDRTTVAGAIRVNGRWSGPVPGVLKGLDANHTLSFQPTRPFFAGEEVFVQISGDLRSQSGIALTHGFGFSFWARSAPASATDFVLVGGLATSFPGEGTVQSYGLHSGDRDGDGSPDMTIPNELADDVRVALNNGCGDYGALEVNPLGGSTTPSANESRDLNGDGVLDFATANISGNSISVMMGDRQGGLEAATSYPAGSIPRGLAMLDVEGDGDWDIVTAHLGSSDLGLFRNLGDGTFAPMQAFDGGFGGEQAVAAGDADGDGDSDLFVAHFFSSRVSLLLNDGLGNFTLAANQPVGGRPWNLTVGDVDGDGALDVVTCSSVDHDLSVVRGTGDGGLFPRQDYPSGAWPIAVDLGDLDGDGDLDLVSSNHDGVNWTVRINDGAGGLAQSYELPALAAGSCATLVDDNRDGRLDIIGVDEVADLIIFWRHAAPADGLQGPSCEARMAIDGWANLAGFASAEPHPIALGGTTFVDISSEPLRAWTLLVGLPAVQPLVSDWGLVHLEQPLSILTTGVTDSQGESRLSFTVPRFLTPGAEVALQVLVDQAPVPVLSNAEVLRITP